MLEELDPDGKFISHRLYRDSCVHKHGRYLKDLRILRNRNLAKTVIVDNSIVAFATHLENGVHIPTYYGKTNDSCLKDIMDLLISISDSQDIRKELDKRIGLKKLYNEYCTLN